MNAIRWVDGTLQAIRERSEPILHSMWSDLGTLALLVTGVVEIVVGVTAIQIANRQTSVDAALIGVVALYGGGGFAVLLSGVLTILRRRRALLQRLLGAMTAGSFGLALVWLSRSETESLGGSFLAISIALAACLLVTHLFEDHFVPKGSTT